ncbi:SpoIIE family protein phosphatase [Streptomyces sp. CA-210063]|uniref:SpoIIE family protein phosphatase n=1 Tax=Streptomyces sp. CA-210063 TaxID=2801029 RepID=UPI00214A9861|nr:SpoIIE family protein phosphatase [Streptomyces sp. CA-210063]UUU33709.1 SpoIIE family protein phosphatase [Streptomyces sp. CA-210063]
MGRTRTEVGERLPSAGVIDEAATARVTLDEQGTVTGWGTGAERLLGYRATEIVGRPGAALLADGADGLDADPRSLAALPRWNGRVALRHRDGRRLDVAVLAHHRTSGTGESDWLVVSALTGTSPEPQDDRLTGWSFTQTPCCTMALYDTGLRLRRANEDMQRALSLTEDEMRGLRVAEIVVHADSDKTERAMVKVLETGEPQYIENYLRVEGESREHAWSVYLVPLRDQDGRTHGVLLSAHDMTEQYWARQRLQLITEASARIGTTLDVTRTAQELADVAVPAIADFVTVDLLASLDGAADPVPGSRPGTADGATELRRMAHQSVYQGVPESVVAVGETDVYPAGSPPVECLSAGRGALFAMTDPGFAPWTARDPARADRIRTFGIHSVMMVPLRARGTILGVAVFVRHQRPEAFERDDLLLAEEITARAAVCVDNARRYTRERSTAVTLQRSLLPQRLPRQAAVDVASRYLPAGGTAGVGGDWFDVIPLSGARVALVVGDVVGHGLHASATMGRLRTAVRTLADVDLPPDELLTHLDDLVSHLAADDNEDDAPYSDGDLGATCLYAVYDPIARRCTLAAAGHPGPALVSPDGTVTLLEPPAGPPLGLGGLPFEAIEVDVPEGSLLALYTNGLIMARDPDIDRGLDVLRHALAQPAASLDGVCDTVLGAMLSGRPMDDIALLVARTRTLDADHVATWDLPADPAEVAGARKLAAGRLAEWGLDDATYITELVVSELVTNAIRHAEPPIQLRLINDRTLICEVSDAASTAPHLRRARTFDEGGRGLMLVAQMTQAWGTRHTALGKTIWAEQALPGR